MIQVYRIVNDVEVAVYSLPKQNAVIKTAIMGVNEIPVSFVSDSTIPAEVGDYIKIENTNYKLNREPEEEKRSEVEYSYDFIFEHPEYTLLDKLYEFQLTGQTSFNMTGRLVDFLALLLWNVNIDQNSLGVDTGWTTALIYSTGYKTLHFEHLNCREVLQKLAEEFSCEYFCNNKEINFVDRIENVTSLVFEQGKGKGLYSIHQRYVDKEDTVTRIRPRGGNKNVPNAHADSEGYLKLPEMYIENFSEHSKVVERQVTFEEVYPHFDGKVSSVSGANNSVFLCPQINFNLNAIAIGDNARINFLSGALMGISFKFQYNHAEKKITLIEQDDDTALVDEDGKRPQVPNSLKKALNGDTFNFTGVIMPQEYVNDAIIELRQKSNKWLDFYSQKRVKFELDVDYRYMRGKPDLHAGDLVVISIPEKSLHKLIRIVALEKIIDSGSINATVSNYLEETWDKYYKDKIEDIKNEIIVKNENLKDTFQGIFKDGIITESELKIIESSLSSYKIEREQLNATYLVIRGNQKLINKAPLNTAWNNYQSAYDDVTSAINTAIADREISEVEKANINNKIELYSTRISELSTAFENARDEIENKRDEQTIEKIPPPLWNIEAVNVIDGEPLAIFRKAPNEALHSVTVRPKFMRNGQDVTDIMNTSTLRLYEIERSNRNGVDDKGQLDSDWNLVHRGATEVTLTHLDVMWTANIVMVFDDEILEQQYQILK